MRRLVVLATAVAGLGALGACRLTLEDDSFPIDAGSNLSASCMAAQTPIDDAGTLPSDLDFIETKIFATACTFSGCHNGANDDAGKMDLRLGMSYASLVGKVSNIDPTRMIVAPGAPNESYLLMMVQHIKPMDMSPPADDPPVDIGFMPQNTGGRPICGPKRAFLERWIAAGAMP